MNAGLLFGIGVLVTLIVAIGIALPVYGAILDGRFQAEHEHPDVADLDAHRGSTRPAA